ncbi:CRP-like cAMP-binding protein [Dysgonomonas sp. PH5-45]|uniref:Crp/Fnr family transcriptional regulator n=1 Tax=unclassified Dysgonomonas TaxID=2630389 RepID=UPI0024768DEA|nr:MULTISPECIES: Crp/Fnr family transcriptional regulator [unclassified Dysgonomonas]MDH6355754.1 CRP-like cAMP-binding protein [Dysgonomonas sp. PH5-45]MDH6388651.1 CRP-like cAMP-binding protein [Dysgonomonas sp. PH5-37]
MLRINIDFLSYIEQLYEEQDRKDITLKKYPKGEFIFEQTNRNNKVIIIKDGLVKCYFSEKNGKDFIFEFLGKGEIVGEIEAICVTPCLCNIETLSDVEAYSFSIAYFKSIINKDIEFNRLLIEELARRIMNTSTRASFQQLYSIKHAVSRLQQLQEKQNINLSKTDMAAYLGIDIRSLNRILKTLNK